ncbi:hypothetical protein TanjilG_17964 [Lupinus angustifolius]|uniref:Peptidase M16 N-terminal domain-containing protein n=1 Tax=Lupinus angustifolius TaxID=3871 RepID=A0A1J7FWZ9_LUPAN|nr:hypothetical protein TanjilG_17964 [Lupinus angustifolius]
MAMSTSASTSIVSLHHSKTTINASSSRFRNNRFFLSPTQYPRLHKAVNGGSSLRANKGDAWKHYISILGEPVTQSLFLPHRSFTSCYLVSRKKRHTSLARFIPGAFLHKSACQFSKSKLDHVSRVQLPHATVGPDEPHAAITIWTDGIAKKQDSSLFVSEIEQIEGFLSSELPSHSKLHRGQLKNGLCYLILPNKVPSNRFEAHLEVHAGSIDEEDDEQGIAHMIEHVAFLGSKKREKLLVTGARSNAYTCIHHTVFHIHAPTSTKDSDGDLLPFVLDALYEIAFQPKFLASRIEKERHAILSELQMMNTIEYRVGCQLLQNLHSENKLSKRFPIGLEEQIKKWDADKIRKFHERWYFPANATLYIVGDIDNISKTVYQIEAILGQTGVESEKSLVAIPSAFGPMASCLVPKLSVGLGGNSSERSANIDQSKVVSKERQTVRPPVKHNWSLPKSSTDLKPPQIFQHELLKKFSISMFCKIPVNKVQTYGDLRNVLMKRIFLSALHFRTSTRYKSSNPPFTSVELDHCDSGRTGCTVTTLTITAEPKNWQSAISVAVQEVRRIKEFGITQAELTRYLDALLKDSEHLAAMTDNVSSVDNLDFIMGSDALGHKVMDQRQGHESLLVVAETVTLKEAILGQTGVESEKSLVAIPSAFGPMASCLVPKLSVGLGGNSSERSANIDQSKVVSKERQTVRPPVKHNWSLPKSSTDLKPPQIFQHELLKKFSISMFCKIPVNKVQTYGDLRNVLMKRIFLSALHFRTSTRYKSSNPPFTSVELDHCDSGRTGCTVTTLTITAEPKNWQSAISVAVQEVRRIKEFGITQAELTRYLDALLKDSEHLAAMTDNVSSVDNLDFIMGSDALGHKVMDQRQGHESLLVVAETVTLKEVNSVGAKLLEFVADFGKPTAPVPAAIVACVPRKVHIEGTGETEFKISSTEITDAMKAGLNQPIEPEPELEVPKELIQSSMLKELKMRCKPAFIPISPEINSTKLYDEETGIFRRRLTNGISVNYKISKTETQSGVMQLIVGGGRAAESFDSRGSVIVGFRTLSEGGRVGNFSREQVQLFCVDHLINYSFESTEEFISMELRFTLMDNGMRAAFQLLHMVLEHSVWVDDAFDRARQLYLSYYRSIPKSLERSTAHKLMVAMLDGDERFVEPTPKSLENLTLQSVKDAVMSQFVGDNMEVNIVGDFTEEEIESCILDYLGTAQATRNHKIEQEFNPPLFRPSPSDLQSQEVILKDTDERACAYIAGPAPNRWGFTVDGEDLLETINNALPSNDDQSRSVAKQTQGGPRRSLRGHPLFFGITMGLLAEIIESRLLTTVRGSLGLTYDVSFELYLFDRLKLGWYMISVTATPGKVHKAVDACKNVLRGLRSNKITERELDRAKRTLLMKHEAKIKSNAYWLGLLAHLQASSVPRKDISCIKDLTFLYEVATVEDIYLAYEQLKVDENSLYSCVGIAGAQAAQEIADPLTHLPRSDHGNNLQQIVAAASMFNTFTNPSDNTNNVLWLLHSHATQLAKLHLLHNILQVTGPTPSSILEQLNNPFEVLGLNIYLSSKVQTLCNGSIGFSSQNQLPNLHDLEALQHLNGGRNNSCIDESQMFDEQLGFISVAPTPECSTVKQNENTVNPTTTLEMWDDFMDEDASDAYSSNFLPPLVLGIY